MEGVLGPGLVLPMPLPKLSIMEGPLLNILSARAFMLFRPKLLATFSAMLSPRLVRFSTELELIPTPPRTLSILLVPSERLLKVEIMEAPLPNCEEAALGLKLLIPLPATRLLPSAAISGLLIVIGTGLTKPSDPAVKLLLGLVAI